MLVRAQECWQDAALYHLAWRGSAAAEEAHYFWIAVELNEVI
jgi:hypothetical protein